MCKHPDTLTAEELSTYQPGWDCVCIYANPINCTCGANWTPREVYELRNMVLDLENQLCKQTELLAAAGDALAATEKANRDLKAADLELDRAWKRNGELEDYISGFSHASSYMVDKETRRAMFEEARKYADNMAQGKNDYNPPTNYALEA